MANILLTQKCVRSCPYCFAKKHMNDSDKKEMLSWEDLIYIANFFQQSMMNHMSLLGGEPTLHPNFVDFLLYLSKRGFKISVFTSGIMSTAKLEELYKAIDLIPEDSLKFVCNLNDPKLSPKGEFEKVEKFFELFNDLITLSFNIYHLDFDMNYLFQAIEKYKLRKHIRLGLAHPIPGEKNKYVTPENFHILIDKLCSYFPVVNASNITLGFDCGFVSCVFTDEQLGQFLRFEKNGMKTVHFECNPAIDIGPDLMVWSCFPLSNLHKKSLYEFNSFREIDDYFKKIFEKIRKKNHGIFQKCSQCSLFTNNQCSGGCLAHLINKSYEDGLYLNLKKELEG